jgi:TonB family protein
MSWRLHLAMLLSFVFVVAPRLGANVPQDADEARLRAAVEADPKAPAPHLALARCLLAAPYRQPDVDRELGLALEGIAQLRAAAPTRPSADVPPLPRAGRDVPMPRLVKHVPPVYPLAAVRAGISGHVILDAVIDRKGRARKIRVARSIADLDGPARDAVEQWRFEPALVNGVAADVAATLVLRFGFRREATPSDDLDVGGFHLERGEFDDAERLVRRAQAVLRDEAAAFARADRRGQPMRPFSPPIKTVDVMPQYPRLAQEIRASGQVMLELLLDETGTVVRARVTRSIPTLDQAALDCVMQWKFTPATANGTPVPIRLMASVNFNR